MPGKDLCPQTWQFKWTPEWLRSKAGFQQSPAPEGSGSGPCWDVEGTISQLFRELTTAPYLQQGKGRRESEGPKSCRRPRGRSPASAEKCMSFESESSLPEVSGQQAEGGTVQRCLEPRAPGLQVGLSDNLCPFRSLVYGTWFGEQTAPFYKLERGPLPLGRCSPLPRETAKVTRLYIPSARPPCAGHEALPLPAGQTFKSYLSPLGQRVAH